jgi:hypothetical protein
MKDKDKEFIINNHAQHTIGDTSFTKLQDGFIQVITKNGCVELMPDEISELSKFLNPMNNQPTNNTGRERTAEEIFKTEEIINSPEWIAGVKFLESCMVKDEDQRFLRFYDSIAGWNKCKEWQTSQPNSAIALIKERIAHLESDEDEGFAFYKVNELTTILKLIQP